MNRKKKINIICVSMIFCLIASIIVGRVTITSYVNNVALLKYLSNAELKVAFCGMGYDEVTYKGYIDGDKIESIDELIGGSDVIVKARLHKAYKRQLYYECVLSQVEVETCYKGSIKKGEYITIFEPVDCHSESVLYCTDGYSLMINDTEYLLFLKKLKNTFFGKSEFVYAPSSTTYSKFICNEQEPKLFTRKELEEENAMYLYEEIKGADVYLYKKDDYNRYLSLKGEVYQAFVKE